MRRERFTQLHSQLLIVELKTVFMFTCVCGTCVVEHVVGDLCSRLKPLSSPSLHPSLSPSLSLSLSQLSGGAERSSSSQLLDVALVWCSSGMF